MVIGSSEMEPLERAKFIIRNRDEDGYVEAYDIFTRASRDGDHEADYSLGLMYARGQGVTKDYTAAYGWFQRAYDGGYLGAGYYLGKMHLMGLGTQKDPRRAQRIFESVADSDCRAMYELGLMFFTGEDVPRDLQRSVEWMEKAAQAGHPEAQFVLGQFYKAGAGVPKDMRMAVNWLTAAALERHKGAQILLGNMYRTGDGVDVDIAESDRWYDMADGRTNPPVRDEPFRSASVGSYRSRGLPRRLGAHLSPMILPSSVRSILIAAGTFGRPGMRVSVPHTGTMNPAPAERLTSLTVSVHPLGAPLTFGSSVREACVFAMHTGSSPYPSATIWSMAFSASLV